MSKQPFYTSKFVNSQVGGIDAYVIDDGPGRGVRALCVNTGGGLRYRVLTDRGLDIDHAFHNEHSLAFLTHGGVTAPSRAYDRGIDWLASFPGGLLTSCGPFNIGPPGEDAGQELGLHGTHSNTAATVESVVQPDPRAGRTDDRSPAWSATDRCSVHCWSCVAPSRLRWEAARWISWTNFSTRQHRRAARLAAAHQLRLPLVDEGWGVLIRLAEGRAEGRPEAVSRFRRDGPQAHPRPSRRASRFNESVAYLFPRATDRSGNTTVGIVNRKLSLGVAIRYSTKSFRAV